jgi:hypothetical protein
MGVSYAIRESDQHYRAEVPMDQILSKLVEDARLNAVYR